MKLTSRLLLVAAPSAWLVAQTPRQPGRAFTDTLPILLLASLLPAVAQTLFAGQQAAVSASSSAAPYVYPSFVIAAFASTGSGSFSNADNDPGFPHAKLAELGLAVYSPAEAP